MRLFHLLLLAVLAGCASKTAPTGPSPGAPAAASTPVAPSTGSAAAATVVPPPRPSTLPAEQQRLAELFRGTPVVFTMQTDGSLRVDVPLNFCFDRAAVAVKPPLAAVLDRLARGQRAETTRLRVTAVADAGTNNTNLARDRAASARDYLVARGVTATRVMIAGATQGEGIEIVVSEAARR